MASVKKKPAAKAKAPAKKKPVAKKAAPKKAAAKKAPAKKTVAAKKPVARKIVAVKAPAKKPAVNKAAPAETKPLGMPEKMRDAALKVLDERQADEIVTIPLAGRSSVADYVIIASGRAARQIAAIADHLRHAFYELGIKQIRVEGQSEANWVLVDAGDVIIHLFRPEVRSYYDLDQIWAGGKTPRS